MSYTLRPGVFTELVQGDRRQFADAMSELGIPLSKTGEPIVNMSRRFAQPLDVRAAASEFGLTEETFRSQLLRYPELSRTLGVLASPGGTVQRNVFERRFKEAAKKLRK